MFSSLIIIHERSLYENHFPKSVIKANINILIQTKYLHETSALH